MLSIWTYQRAIEVPYALFLVGFILFIVGVWLIGFVWDKQGLFKAQQEFHNERNQLAKELRKFMKKKRFK